MKLLEMICKELGVEVGDSWAGDAGKQYKINEYGQVRVWNEEYGEWIESYYNLGHIVNGDLKPKWKPKEGEKYYIPNPAYFTEEFRSTEREWTDTIADHEFLKNSMVFKTQEEATKVANKMLKTLKEE